MGERFHRVGIAWTRVDDPHELVSFANCHDGAAGIEDFIADAGQILGAWKSSKNTFGQPHLLFGSVVIDAENQNRNMAVLIGAFDISPHF